MEMEMCKLCFTMAANQQPVTNSPFSQEFYKFKFIELQIGYDLPETVCGQCLVQLNQLGSFLKMCKDSFHIYKRMRTNQQKSAVKDIKQEPIDCETVDRLDTNLDGTNESENLSQTFSNREMLFETVMLTEPMKTELNSENSSDDSYHDTDGENIKAITKKETMCQTCGANVNTLFDHYTKSPKCWPRSSKCHMCNVYFRNKRRLLLHQKARHQDQVPMTVLICHICSKTFKFQDSLSQHLQEHESSNQYACDQSDMGSSSLRHQEERHIHKKFKRKTYSCSDCGKTFTSKNSLYKHQINKGLKVNLSKKDLTCQGIKMKEHCTVVCEMCNRRFSNKGFKLHLRTHSKVNKKYECKICQIEFETAELYRQHLKIHKTKEYLCTFCPRRCSAPSHLKKHMLIHTGERPFSCSECDKTFRLDAHLKRHRMAVHDENRGQPFKCRYCRKGFTFKANLLAHERIHTGERPYKCHICDGAFAHPCKRKNHVRKCHGEDEVENISLN